MATTIHQEITFTATPAQVYRALMGSAEHAAFTGAPADVSGDEGGACSWHGGYVSGRNIELVPDTRIVQAWRAKNWDPGIYSIIRYELVPQGSGTQIVFNQVGHPEGTGEHLENGWHERYWKPLAAYLDKG
jgi:uncharacterized protein YndB with AHSA1/START domain